MTIYPTFDRYKQKLKANIYNVNDIILNRGKVIMDKRGIYPFLITGGRAIIFKIQVGGKFYALKCWNAELSGLEKRFKKIDSYLKQISLPYFVDFTFSKNGFKGDKPNEYFPILRMEWVDGCTLTDFVKRNYSNSTKIKEMARQFLEMVQKLHEKNISHGDLQGGNIMVNQNEDICLIDYDSICTLDLINEKNSIAGLPGFQHPLINKSLGIKADYFSELVIYLSLLTFSEDQKLAQNIDDKKWLFSENDLKNANSATIFKILMGMSSDIQNLTKLLKEYCSTADANKLEPLENIVGANINPWDKVYKKSLPVENVKNTDNPWDKIYKKASTTLKPSVIPIITIKSTPANITNLTEGNISGYLTILADVTLGAILSYQWYKNITSNSNNWSIINGATSSSYKIPIDLTVGTYYYYCEVTANGGTKPVNSKVATVIVCQITTLPKPMPPSSPSAPKIIRGREQLEISWTPVTGVHEYEVWYGTSSNTPTLYGTYKKSPVVIQGLDSETTYYVRLKAKNSSGVVSGIGQIASETPQVNFCRLCRRKPKPGDNFCSLCRRKV